jgi:hypothetical protein
VKKSEVPPIINVNNPQLILFLGISKKQKWKCEKMRELSFVCPKVMQRFIMGALYDIQRGTVCVSDSDCSNLRGKAQRFAVPDGVNVKDFSHPCGKDISQ